MRYTMMKRLLCLLLCLLLGASALADTDIYHTPTRDQLSKKEALALMADFYQSLWNVDITPCFRKGEYTALFGPGYQWQGNTEEDCWVISIEFDTELPIVPHILLHGTTGEVLQWSFRERETKVTYQGAIPGENDLTLEEAIAIAKAQFAEDMALRGASTEGAYLTTRSYGLYGQISWPFEVKSPEQAIWHISIVVGPECHAMYNIHAADGSILESSVHPEME